MRKWLDDNGINIPHKNATRDDLLKLCRLHKKPLDFVLDAFVRDTTNNRILRLPPYYFVYNPIELVWGLCKRYYDCEVGRGQDYSMENARRIWTEAL